jgi:hypothetical protein
MKLTEKDVAELRSLEESLWIESTRFDLSYMNRVLHEDFFEFGRGGKVFDRQEILDIPAGEINATIPFEDFKVHPLVEYCVMVTYVSEERYAGLARANRCSIWLKTPDGWRLRFHQGTPLT